MDEGTSVGIFMEASYGIICRRNRSKKAAFNLAPFLWRAPSSWRFVVHSP
jgi:hypothetical protein